MIKLVLYHGSPVIVHEPDIGKSRGYKDFGQGFYCSEHIEMAKEWACSEGEDGFANKYEIDMAGLKILNLSTGKYTILHWLAILAENRRLRLSTPIMKQGAEWLKNNYSIDISPYDVIVGYRADDSYFSFAKEFLDNKISLEQLKNVMKLGKLGEQVVIRTPEAISRMKFIEFAAADNYTYYPKRKSRDLKIRTTFVQEGKKSEERGLYMANIIKEGISADDLRLR